MAASKNIVNDIMNNNPMLAGVVNQACITVLEGEIATLQSAVDQLKGKAPGKRRGRPPSTSKKKAVTVASGKRRGRPPGSKNKPKDGETATPAVKSSSKVKAKPAKDAKPATKSAGMQRAPKGAHQAEVLRILKASQKQDGMSISDIKAAAAKGKYSFGASLNSTMNILKNKGKVEGWEHDGERAHTFTLTG